MSILRTTLSSGLRLANTVCRPLGVQLKRSDHPLRNFRTFFDYVVGRGFDPQTIFDVGVGFGTPELYRHFSEKKIVLVEPLPIYQDVVKQICQQYNADNYQVAASNEDGELDIIVEQEFPERSSVMARSEHTRVSATDSRVTVPMMKLDTVVQEHEYREPYLLKIDTEGFELSVLQGATEMLKKTEMVVLETSIGPRFENGYESFEIFKFMDDNNFLLFDILGGSINKAGMLNCVDTVFIPKGSSLREV